MLFTILDCHRSTSNSHCSWRNSHARGCYDYGVNSTACSLCSSLQEARQSRVSRVPAC